LKVTGTPTGRRSLSPQEKKVVLDHYVQGIQCLLGAISSSGARIGHLPAASFLQVSLERALTLQQERRKSI